MCQRLAMVALAIALSAGSGAAGAAPAPVGTLDPDRAISLARALADDARSEGPAGVLASVLAAQGTPAAALPVPPVPAPTGVPATISRPVALLVGAAGLAEAERSRALAPLTPAEGDRILAGGISRPGPAPTALRPPPGRSIAAGVGSGRWEPAADALAIARKVDQHALRTAALTILSSIDAVTPALRAAARDREGSSGVPSACGATGDMVFESGDCSLMIGGTGPNGYGPGVTEGQMLIDLGGDDTYSNGAARAELEVRLLVDVSGDDTYVESAASSLPGAGVLAARGQGVGLLGVGVLADLGGSDTYRVLVAATAPQPGAVARPAEVVGQGGSTLGAGVLVDVGGTNSFELRSSSSGAPAAARGQGAGTAGLGALIALGSPTVGGGDIYTARATSALHEVERTSDASRYTIGSVSVETQGAGLAGAGVLVDAFGDDTYEAHAEGGVADTLAQGAGSLGAGALIDADGDDSMLARASGDTDLSLVTTNPSACWTLAVTVTTGPTEATAQGAGLLGAGLLVDGSGSDIRRVAASSSASAIAEARSSLTCPNSATATATSGSGTARGQGAGSGGAGALVDLAGSDANDLDATNEAYARALAIGPGPNVEAASATAGDAATRGLGSAEIGAGAVADALGRDRYVGAASKTETRVTSAGETTTPTPGSQRVHGWGMTGVGWLVDLDGVDLYAPLAPVSAAGNDRCWTNGPDGRGRDVQVGAALPPGCP